MRSDFSLNSLNSSYCFISLHPHTFNLLFIVTQVSFLLPLPLILLTTGALYSRGGIWHLQRHHPYSTEEIICTDDLLCGLIVLRWLCISSCSDVVTIITLVATDLHRLPFNRASPSVAVIMKKASSVMPSLWCVIIDNDVSSSYLIVLKVLITGSIY